MPSGARRWESRFALVNREGWNPTEKQPSDSSKSIACKHLIVYRGVIGLFACICRVSRTDVDSRVLRCVEIPVKQALYKRGSVPSTRVE